MKNHTSTHLPKEMAEYVLDISRDAVITANMDGEILMWNQAATKIFGYQKEEVLGEKVDMIIPHRYLNLHRMGIERIKEGLPPRILDKVIEGEGLNKNGSEFPMDLCLKRWYIDGQPYLTALIRNTSKKKAAQAEQEKLQGQLRQAQKMEAIGRLAGGVAHDFNNVLSVIMGYGELAQNLLETDHSVQGHLAEILKAAQRSEQLTLQLLAFARKQSILPRVLDINEQIKSVKGLIERLIGEHIGIELNLEENLWNVELDPGQLEQILMNLAVNARDAIEDHGTIKISTANLSKQAAMDRSYPGFYPLDYVVISFEDTGKGMDRHTLNHIFEPFFTTKSITKGTGLGLATIYGIVKQNHGYIKVKSEPNSGTVFDIYLKRAKKPLPKQKRSSLKKEKKGTETILLVEDEPQFLSLLKDYLTQAGYHVLASENPIKAIELARESDRHLDLLITDVIMPKMNGRTVYETLKKEVSDLKVIFMSGFTADSFVQESLKEGHSEFLQKPFSVRTLGEAVYEILSFTAEEI